ncbi:MAG: DNA primase [Betaproteobacteria bacterium]|nr:DNA primase [Betaproteobacteria bacterium]
MIPQSFIQDLLSRVDIVDVVDRHVKLKRAGANYVACCPFHGEKTPSFTVSPTKQFYHCFGCGAHGTAVGFLMEYSGLGFVDAVKDLAQSVGMKVPEVRSELAQRKAEAGDDLYGVLLRAAQYYRAQLKDAARAIDYLKRRGLSGEIAKRFGIGYAPDGWQNLAAAFPDYNAKALATAGLVKVNEDHRRYDVFRDRIMFPIVDVRGNVIGFGGRVLGEGEPKYLNSPETPIFEKGRELYGLYQARGAIRRAGRVVVVEGYMDVVALAQHEVEYAVATLGTATTPLHVQKLLRQADEVVFCFDGDDAGRRAAWRALENSLAQLVDGKQVRFLFLPQGEDPDTYVRKAGKEAFETLIAGAPPLSRFLLDELASRVDLSAAEGRAAFIHQARPLLKPMQSNALRVQIVREVAALSRLAPEEVERLCELAPMVTRTRTADPRSPRMPQAPLARQLLRLLMGNPKVASTLSSEQHALLSSDPELAPVAALVELLKNSGATSLGVVFEASRDSNYADIYEAVAGETLLAAGSEETVQADLDGVFAQLELRRVQSEYTRLCASGGHSESEQLRFQELKRRLAELKGVGTVNVRSQI